MTKATKIVALIGAAILIILGVAFVATSFSKPEAPANASSLAYTDFEKGKSYKFDTLLVIDCYATYGNENTENYDTLYLMCAFGDVNVNSVIVSVPVAKSDDIYDKAYDYMMDETAEIGDFVLNCYLEYRSDIRESTIKDYYDECYEQYKPILATELEGMQCLQAHFGYVCDGNENYEEFIGNKNTTKLIMGIAFVVLGGLLAFFIVRKSKETEPAAEAEISYVSYPTPEAYTPVSTEPVVEDTPEEDVEEAVEETAEEASEENSEEQE
ncbi:MAG: hypothetical protein E7595_00785 [Ruminococcaceae bacterium]|nr:hypothetical protein [Oscillospiraceae bacterium]